MSELSKRIKELRENYKLRYSEEIFKYRREVFDIALTGDRPRVIELAIGLKEYLETKPIDLRTEDVLAGHGQFVDWTHSNPEYYEEIERLKENQKLTEEQRFLLKQVEAGMRMRLYSRYPSGHVIPNYEKLLKIGYDELIINTKQAKSNACGEHQDFYEASLLVLQGTQKHILRYAEKAEELLAKVKHGSEEYKNLSRIKNACIKIAHCPPEDFFEAVQLLWLAHEVTTSEQVCGSLSFGRIDQYLYPFYEKSLKAHKITREEAEEIIQAFWLKVAGLTRGFQNVTLGGMGIDGKDQCNELTMICLETTRLIKTDQPSVALRVNENIPEDVWEKVMEVLQTGIGFPALFCDQAIIPCRQDMGATKREAYDYGIVGCAEPAVPGKEYGHTEGFRINWPKVLELVLNGGKCPITGEYFKLNEIHSLDEFETFEEFYLWVKREFSYVEKTGIEYMQMADAQFSSFWPTPYLSTLMDGCLEKGLDVTAGGTIYNFSTINAAGMANLTDSLVAIREAVFQRKWIPLDELRVILSKNFEGYEGLREKLRGLPKYGNGIQEVDKIYRELSEQFIDEIQKYINPRGGKYQIGFYSVENHAIMGKVTGATPDGRRACTALANSTSPAQGIETVGPTATLRSVLTTPMDRLGNGMVLDMKFHPTFFREKRHREAIRALIEIYFEQGGQEIQFNVIDRETLLDAKKHPERYQDLIVRVSGYSAFFVTLDPVTQDEIIAREEYRGI